MIELSLEIVTWVCVVVVQAVLHFVVLGARQERIQQDEEDLILEESLSLATNESSLDMSIDEMGGGTGSYDVHPFPDISLHDGNHYCEKLEPSSPEDAIGPPGLMILGGHKILDREEDPHNFLHLLSQTGSEMVKSRSIERLVQQQIRARAE